MNVSRLLALALAPLVTGSFASAQLPARNAQPHCSFVGSSHSMSFVPGQPVENFLVTSADPEPRRFIVYVPSSYGLSRPTYPVVYMLHGTGQTATSPITNLTWDELAEARDFIAVFPEALEYDLQDGTRRTKWATDAVANYVVEPYELPLADDALFLRELHNTLGAHLAIDCERIYASGFSNGGAFVKINVRVELADIFAATSSAGGIGTRVSFPGEHFPANGFDFRPHFEIVGNKDLNKRQFCVDQGDLPPGDTLPMAAADIVATPCMWDPLTTMAFEMGLDPLSHAAVEQANRTQFRWNVETLPGPHAREYRFVILRNLTHEYPSGNNYPIDYVPIYYEWMLGYTR